MTTGIRTIYSWREKTSEIEFLLSIGENIIPIEVKAGINTKAKSLQIFNDKYKPKISLLLSGQPKDFRKHTNLCLPLYLASTFTSMTATPNSV
jgi:predicted AAA+ superfamily ATPase